MSTSLSRSLLQARKEIASSVARGPSETFPERVVQFGEGNFLRAFADWMIDEVNARQLFRGSVLVAQPIRQGLSGQLNAQDGVYTLLMRGVQDGKVVESRRIITSTRRAVNPYEQWPELVAAFRSPHLRFVLSNTTEAGIAYVLEPHAHGVCPESFPGKVAALLYERYVAVRGDVRKGLIFLPCELIDRNGDTLRRLVLEHARNWALPPGFEHWVKEANYFLNTLVDRLVPGYPRTEAERLCQELGYDDKLMVASEFYHLWVIEGPRHLADELPFAKAGLNVVWTDDLTPYRTRKVRVLNGGHTCSVLAAYLSGIETVADMMEDSLFGPFVRRAIFDEILPTVGLPQREKRAYAESVLERFSNPFVRHELLSIALNSAAKWRVRVLPSLLDYRADRTGLPPLLTFSLAALVAFYRGRQITAHELEGSRAGQPYAIQDEPPVLACFADAWRRAEADGDLDALVRNVLGRADLWGEDLNRVEGLAASVSRHLETIARDGMRAAVSAALKQS